METTLWWHMQLPLPLLQLVEVKGTITYLSVLFSSLDYLSSYHFGTLFSVAHTNTLKLNIKMMVTFADHDRAHYQPVCQNCATSTTPLWRRDEIGSVLCNACGLFLKLHGTPRPISLKTDVIKSRHRVKTASQALKKRVSRSKKKKKKGHYYGLCLPPL